ncbi:hypothetical protein [Streptomyces sp. NPDC058653]|uniref:hypothetical protein n=1 Tax=Streptomyces sp. NPDC058653 TaxID=3346576 RepID=UPI0036544CB0
MSAGPAAATAPERAAQPVSKTYSKPGKDSFKVPGRVRSLTVDVIGAGGAEGGGGPVGSAGVRGGAGGGGGARITCTVPVQQGWQLPIVVATGGKG